MKLYFHPASTYAQKVLIALEEKGIEVEKSLVQLMDPDANAEYRKLYPLGKIPLLMIDDHMIPESTIIIEYLEGHYADAGTRLIPEGVDAARQVRFMDRMNDLYLINSAGTLFFSEMKPEGERDQAAIDRARATLDIIYAKLEQRLGENQWLAGEQFSMADCSAIAGLLLAENSYPFAGKYPQIQAYFERALDRPSVTAIIQAGRIAQARVREQMLQVMSA